MAARAVRQKEKIAPLGLKDNGGSAHCKSFKKKGKVVLFFLEISR
ncbi:hypothetical protein [Halalkalibacter flavus]